MKILKGMPDKSVDLLFADPPYFSGPEKRGYYGRLGEPNGVKRRLYQIERKAWKVPGPKFFKEVKRVAKVWIVFGANYYKPLIGTPFKAPRHKDFTWFLESHPYKWILWDKVNYSSRLNDCELALTNVERPSMIFRYMWNGMMQGRSIKEGHIMQPDKSLNEKRIHPTQKPLNLCKWIIDTYAKPGDVIFDTHMGSQALRIAAYDMRYRGGYNYIGCEINKKNFDEGCERYRRFAQQQTLF